VRPVEGTPPVARSYHTMAAVGSKLYVFGGCCISGRLNDLHCFNTETSTWQVRRLVALYVPPRGERPVHHSCTQPCPLYWLCPQDFCAPFLGALLYPETGCNRNAA
jgi:hypothetical protein